MKGLLFVYALSYGGAIVALRYPYVGFLAYVCLAILRPEYLWEYSIPQGGNFSRILGIGMLIGWGLHGFGNWRFGRATLPLYSLLGLLVWSTFSAAVIASDKDLAWNFVDILAKIVAPFLVGITLIDSVDRLKQLAWVIVLSQGYLAFEFNMWYFDGYNRLWIEGFGGMDNNGNAIALVTGAGLAGFLGIAAGKWWQKGVAFGAAALMVHAIFFSFSRGGMLALCVTSLVAFLLIPKRPIYYLGFVVAVLVGIRMAGPEVVDRFSTVFASSEERDYSQESRLDLWKACIDSMTKNPLGVGTDNWGEVVIEYGFVRGKQAHSVWLELGAELGVVGLAMLVGFYGGTLRRVWSLTRESMPVSDPWLRHLARMVVASLIGFIVSAQFVSLDLLEPPYYVVLIGAGLLKLTMLHSREGHEAPVRSYA
jgi:probable O-glycosylation ligase (exosortase A-associated)